MNDIMASAKIGDSLLTPARGGFHGGFRGHGFRGSSFGHGFRGGFYGRGYRGGFYGRGFRRGFYGAPLFYGAPFIAAPFLYGYQDHYAASRCWWSRRYGRRICSYRHY
jgi:hypothetical protein